jgi:hypothetical protein
VLWIVKALLVVAKSRRGRKLLVAAGVGAAELAQGDRARKLYAQARARVDDPVLRERLARSARSVEQAIRRR